MAIIGGFDPDNTTAADAWPLGLGIFDLSDMVFKDHYDAGALPYTSPNVVKRWHTENGNISKSATDDVKRLFGHASATGSRPSSGSDNKGAIAGGIVGGILVLSALAAGVWFYLRRKRNRRQPLVRQAYEPDSCSRYEADGKQKFRYEADGNETHEKEALQQQRHELL